MRKIFLAGTVLLFSYASFAAPVSETTHSKKAASTSKSHTSAHALKKNTTTTKHTHSSKSKSHHQRQMVPQVHPATLSDENDSAVTATPAADTESTQPTEDAPKKSSLFSWFNRTNTSDQDDSTTSNSWTHSIAQHLTSAAHKTVATLHYSTYRFGGNHFDTERGIYMLDCSGYLDNILHQNSPKAYSMLAMGSGSYKPNSEHYYNFFNHLTAANGDSDYWNKVETPEKLEAGDILVFRYTNSRGRSSGGHVMLVMDKPTGNSEVVKVRVADSAATGHSADTRGNRASGIGIGTLLLKVNPATGQPYAFAWRVNSPWNSRVNIAMGRPPTA